MLNISRTPNVGADSTARSSLTGSTPTTAESAPRKKLGQHFDESIDSSH